ncbi:hypothetical protein FOZ63_026052 [Perkinsus olseni]|uniref:Uncharacterized protein n=1 Tax=Perkinsus olseni TaxID=32597 RepID=A0A7J6U255_PEROL|nr:hypothetical protein FOZ63_026052 [Perkinsus olseni]
MPIVEENTTAGAAGHSQISSPRTPPIHRNDINTGTATIRRVASREERAHNRRSGQSSGSVTSRCTGRFTIEDGGSVRFDSLPGGSVSIRRKETLDELDLVEPVPEFGCAWQSSSSCCELAAVSDDACGGLSPNDREQSRSVCADLPKAQLTVKVPKRIGRFDVVDATPRAAPPPSIATDMRESSVDSHQIVQIWTRRSAESPSLASTRPPRILPLIGGERDASCTRVFEQVLTSLRLTDELSRVGFGVLHKSAWQQVERVHFE